uniref:Peptidase family M48 n=1 Tax=Candidatus Kentrum sp. LFY TaxID=2126342 RepID=A0A450UKG4_9GAMM|nr:MAG: Peptidase family M48 [Candidatus Kentron sp. LFY]
MLGANAFAFPGGPIVVTGDLVEILDDDELLAVIAHEYGHIEDRHSLKQIIDLIGVSVLAYVLFGADDSIVEEITAVAIDIWAFKNSRGFEKEADLEAMEILRANHMKPASFVEAIEKLIKHGCKETDGNSSRKCLSDARTDWFPTHPDGAERVKYLSEQID